MKTKKNLFRPFSVTAYAAVAFAMSSLLHGQSWDGGDVASNGWGAANNWNPDGVPASANTTALTFNNMTRPVNATSTGITVKSIAYGSAINAAFTTNFQNFNGGSIAANLTLAADSGNAAITVDPGAIGDISLGWNGLGTNPGSFILNNNLDVTHDGSGILLFSRQVTGVGGITKLGSGTMNISAFPNNTFSGPANINAGRLIVGNTNTASASADFFSASAVNLGGGTLEVRTTVAVSKIIANSTTVSSASTLAYNNTTAATRTLTLNTGSLVLNADLTVQNISSDTALASPVVIGRALTGAGDLLVDGYNTFTSSTTSFGNGRVALGGNNSGWSGDLVIREGAAEIFGDTAVGAFSAGTGDVFIGQTGSTAGAALLFSASTPTAGAKTFANDIVVRADGFRTLRGGSDHSYNINGSITLEGDLNVHNGLFFNDKNMTLNGVISGAGDLTVTTGTLGGFTRLTANNSGWSGDLVISNGTVNLFGTSNTSGTGDIVMGATGSTSPAALSFSHAGSITYTNDIIVNTGGSGGTRTITGNSGLGINVTFNGGVTLNGDLTLNHSWSTADRRLALGGAISGNGGLTITRTAGSLATTSLLTGVSTYTGPTIVKPTASLAISSTASLTSNITVESTARLGGGGGTTGNLTLDEGANFFFFYSPTYVPFDVSGTVTVNNPSTFGIDNLVGGSQGEVVPWASIPDGTYTLIGTTATTFNTIGNFGPGGAVTNVAGSGKTVYFQNGGGTGSGGLQIVIATDAADPFAAWSFGAAFNDDTNNDGIGNGLAFLLGAADVNVNANSFLPAPTQTGGALTLTFKMRDLAARGTASLQVQHSSDLGISDSWSTLITVPDATSTIGGI
ncbi:MAG: beta strand repeat-containing protein, partial [Luteolibacter sp.]